jgi:hypothetical protein
LVVSDVSPLALYGGKNHVTKADSYRTDYDPPLDNANTASGAARALGKELAPAKHRILVFAAIPL